ncbi:hypothetical protein BX666DRAFT_1322088 [Dichotomocladium elegans]|nr:hypothetical protein BX666DRAFT_1322088 [Dichotomocladium elegans]
MAHEVLNKSRREKASLLLFLLFKFVLVIRVSRVYVLNRLISFIARSFSTSDEPSCCVYCMKVAMNRTMRSAWGSLLRICKILLIFRITAALN